MIRVLLFFQIAAYATVAFVFGFVGVVELQHYKYVHPAILRALAAEDQGARTITAAQQLIGKADRSYDAELKNANDIGNKTGQVLDNLNGAATNANQVLVSLNDTVKGLNASQAKIADSATTTLDEARNTIQGVQPIETQAQTEVLHLQNTTDDLDTLLKSQDIISTAHNMNVITANFGSVSTDFQKKFHDVLYPPKCEGRWCWAIKAWPYLKDASEMTEPAYWGYELVQAMHH